MTNMVSACCAARLLPRQTARILGGPVGATGVCRGPPRILHPLITCGAFTPLCVPGCLADWLPACLPAWLPVRLRACVPACLPRLLGWLHCLCILFIVLHCSKHLGSRAGWSSHLSGRGDPRSAPSSKYPRVLQFKLTIDPTQNWWSHRLIFEEADHPRDRCVSLRLRPRRTLRMPVCVCRVCVPHPWALPTCLGERASARARESE